MSTHLGIDTSNYTTSTALFDGENVIHSKKLLAVKEGNLGLRQNEAVFQHVKQLPKLLKELSIGDVKSIGVSDKPRNIEGSYMPCFMVGNSFALSLGQALNVPVNCFSHQQGHIAAALYSCGRLDLLDKAFIAFHLSGGTGEGLVSTNGVYSKLELVSKTLDLSPGQAVDRVGLMLGLNFPCGKALEQLALEIDYNIKTKVSVKNYDYSLSGVENQCKKMLENGLEHSYIARYCLQFIIDSLEKVLVNLLEEYKGLPIIFSGGVASNSLIREYFQNKYEAYFAQSDFSCDNASGVAILSAMNSENPCMDKK